MSALPIGSKIEGAMIQAASGGRVFPLVENTTTPLIPNWREVATADQSIVRQCWAETPEANIGVVVDNLLVFHTTTVEGVTALGDLFRHHLAETPKTHCIVLGINKCEQHHYAIFALPQGTRVRRIENILSGVTALASDDFLVGPGSVVNRYRCTYTNAHPIAAAPKYLMELCGVEVPSESKPMNNVVQMRSAVTTEAVPKTKFEWVKDAVARLHIDVFPVRAYVDPGPNATPEERLAAAKAAKTPLIRDWQNEATQDLTKLKAWWNEWPDANIGGSTQNHIAVDIDPRNGGDATFAGLVDMGQEFPDTATTRTQSGGQHLIYVAPDGPVKGGTNKLGPGIDIKARGGYVLLPGSTIEGRLYDRETVRPPAFAPQWLVDLCKAARAKTDAAGKRIVEEDDTARELFERWMLKHAPMAYDGEIDNTTYKMCARGRDFGCSKETVYEVVSEWDQTHCFPQNNPDRLHVVVESAGRNRENAIGSAHPLAPGFEPVEIAERPAPPAPIPSPDLIQTSAEFVRGFVPPEYLVDQVLQRRFCYSLTAQTGVGKTAVAMLLSAHVGAGRSLGNLDVDQGTVLYFAGENPTDIQMRWLGITRELNLDPATADVHFIPGAMPLSQVASRIAAEVTRKGLRPALVVVDTAAAYFEGDDENSNTQAVAHARRMRALTELPGGPCVLILCHPTKRAADDDLIPRGGGAFLAEVDGNIALQKRESVIVASALGKFRGRDFVPLSFELKTVRHPVLQDARGRPIPTVVARHLGEIEKQRLTTDTLGRENQLLKAVHDHPEASLRDLAEMLGWRYKTGQPDQSKVTRALKALAGAKLLRQYGRRWQLTPAGETELKRPEQAAEPALNDGIPL
ncbi:MAG: RecA-family ATPase [Bradyrhizobium sp.]|nr:RecA-family ATPase [Bradyrhizobium sp.]